MASVIILLVVNQYEYFEYLCKNNIREYIGQLNFGTQMGYKNVKEIVRPQLGLQPERLGIIFAGKEP
ncbi:hypothetical protein CVS40_4683 [Lucilia cuprina]|nr:hypothetical protein CVS40_4683 [Lucilia cuprina]